MNVAAASETVRVRKGWIAVVSVLATAIGTAPFALYVGQGWLAPLLGLAAGAMAFPALASFTTRATKAPRPFEFVLGGIGAFQISATVAWLGLFVFFLLNLGAKGLAWAGSLVSDGFALNAGRVAFWGSLAVTIVMALSNAIPLAQKLAGQLYPQTAGLRSAFHPLLTFQRRGMWLGVSAALVLIAGGAVLLALLPATGSMGWVQFALAYCLAMVSIPFSRLGKEEAGEGPEGRVLQVARLFQAMGFTYALEPRTHRDSIDPLLVDGLDFYAERGSEGVAVRILSAESPEDSSDGSEVESLVTAAWALGRFFSEQEEAIESIQPEVILLGKAQRPEVRIFEKKGDIRVSRIAEPEALGRAAKLEDGSEELRKLASELLEPARSEGGSRNARSIPVAEATP